MYVSFSILFPSLASFLTLIGKAGTIKIYLIRIGSLTLIPNEFIIEVRKACEDVLDLVSIIELSLWANTPIHIDVYSWLGKALSLFYDIRKRLKHI